MNANIYSEGTKSLSGSRKPLVFSGAGLLSAGFLLLSLPAVAQVNVVMQHYDLNRTGANLQETELTPANVNVNSFGKLFSHSVDGKVYAQPLYVAGLSIGGTTHNVVYVCTDNDSLYALDADTGSQLWHDNFGTPVPNGNVGSCSDMSPQIGITGTPVIDTANGTLYVDARTLSGSTYAHKLHAISLTTGAEEFGGPVTISASVNGKSFNAHYQHQRPGLLLLNGVIYLGYGSDCDDNTYYGWLLGYNETTLSQTAAFCTTPSGSQGAIWSCGMAPAVDGSGNIYVITGNGSFNANQGGSNLNYSECFLKLSSPGLNVLSYFCPSNQGSLTSSDEDLGSGGAVLLPGTDLVVGGGKQGLVYLCNINSLGGYSTSKNNVVQQFSAWSETDRVGQSPVYWQGPSHTYLYFSAEGSKTKAYTFNGSTINTSPVAQSSETQGNPGGISVSANGTANGILWVVDSGSSGTLRAYNADASSSFSELWNSQDNSSRDSLGSYVKFVSPIVVNGKVYVGTANSLIAYGLLNTQPDFTVSATPSSQTVTAGDNTSYTVNVGSVNGFSGSVSLAASGLPSGASANFNPSSVSAPGSSTMTVTTSTSTPAGTSTLTVQGTSGSTSHTTTVGLTVNVGGTLSYEAESLSYTTNGAAAALQTDSNSSGGKWVALEASATGPYIEFTLPNVPAGTYQLQMEWKGNTSRGILSLSVDGATLGGNLDQYSATQTYPTTTFGTVTLGAGNHTVRLTVVGKNSASSSDWLSADRFILVPTSTTLNFEAESLSYTTNGAAAALQTDSNSSGGKWIALEATGTGPYIEFTLPNLPAGTYQLQMEWKGNNTRGILSLSVDGTTLGGNLDQYSATQTYPTTTFGNVTLSAGNHLVRLTVVGKNASSGNYWLSADKFTLVGQ